MYYFPFLLLTADDIRNNSIADMLQDELNRYLKKKKVYIDSLPDSVSKKDLHDLAEMQKVIDFILIDVFRSNMNVLAAALPEIDLWRLKDKLKRILTIMRRRSADLVQSYEDYIFADKVAKLELWEDHPCLARSRGVAMDQMKPVEWNALFLNRISDIHQHVYKLIRLLEDRSVFTRVSDQTADTDGGAGGAEDLSIGTTLDICRLFHKEVKDYLRIIDSL